MMTTFSSVVPVIRISPQVGSSYEDYVKWGSLVDKAIHPEAETVSC